MYQPNYFNNFVLSLEAAIKPETIIYIETYQEPHATIDAEQFHISDFAADKWSGSRVFVFDYFSRPISKLVQILHMRGAEIVFVQHGSLSQLDQELQTGAKRLFWQRLKNRVSIMAQVGLLALRTGTLSLLRDNPRAIDLDCLAAAYVFIDQDARYFKEIEDRCLVCQSADSGRFRHASDAGAVFISQPLIEDRIVDRDAYLSLFERLVAEHDVHRVIAHPRDKVLANYAHRKELAVSRLGDQPQYPAAAAVGHYSTLLFEIQGVEVIRLAYADGAEIERFQSAGHEDRPLIADALRDRYGPASANRTGRKSA
ncbi:hypothetical protein QTA57_14285 [Fontisubflavum oceani]|uniref:hypothetical protein n=1 Tax=Fontisubflavum oceani TaxID=2978973 RepID=UPI0025B2E6BD|nr:hypothetical protein [Fontisubflavum oceani]WJY20962.1 hypothetical protein QTA57_14285 [Fontisubflavum oceani]